MARVIVEVEEIIALKEYKNIKIRVCLDDEFEDGQSLDQEADALGDMARKAVKSQARKLLKTIDPSNLAGGRVRQWSYKNGRKRRGTSED